MSHRKFADRDGTRWAVRVSSKHEWRFEPVPGNPRAPRRARPPLYAGDDPFELSERELQTILGTGTRVAGQAGRAIPLPPKKKSPFLDDHPANG